MVANHVNPYVFGGGAYPIVEDFETTTLGTAGAGMTINSPGGINAGELLVLLISTSTSSGEFSGDVNPIAGWNWAGSSNAMGGAGNLTDSNVFWKIATGAEGNVAVTFRTNAIAVARYLRISGADPVSPISNVVGLDETTTDNSITLDGIEVNSPFTLGVFLGNYRDTVITSLSINNSWVEQSEVSAGASTGLRSLFATREFAATGDSGDTQFTANDSRQKACVMFGVNPTEFEEDAYSGPVVAGIQKSTLASANTSFTLVSPGSISAGDLLIAAVANDEPASGDLMSTPAGWTKVAEAGSSTTDCHASLYYKVAVGGETNIAITTTNASEWVGWYLRVTGAATSSVLDTSANADQNTNLGTWQMPAGITTTVDNCFGAGIISVDTNALTEGVTRGARWIERDWDGAGSGSNGVTAFLGLGKFSYTGAVGPLQLSGKGADESMAGVVGAFRPA